MGDLKVGYEALDAAAADILNAVNALDDKLNAMEKRMEGRKAEWHGSDSDAYDIARAGWDKEMKGMRDILTDVAKAVGLSREEYQAAEKNNAKRFSWG